MTRRGEIRKEISALRDVIQGQKHDIANTKMKCLLGCGAAGGTLMMGGIFAGPIAGPALMTSGYFIARGGELVADAATAKASKKVDEEGIQLRKLEKSIDTGPEPGLLPWLQRSSVGLG